MHHKYFLLGVRIAVGVIAVSFIIAGICNGNMSRILEKAINICMECIGLG
ncbi:MAG: thioredoxin [Clostridia bacterium]|nr:thioredoxin [Clostridia bacterium]